MGKDAPRRKPFGGLSIVSLLTGSHHWEPVLVELWRTFFDKGGNTLVILRRDVGERLNSCRTMP
jgi:hypothetical protein